jgi:hypothetical protein
MDTADMIASGAAAIELMVHGAVGLPDEPMIDDLKDLPEEFIDPAHWSFGTSD